MEVGAGLWAAPTLIPGWDDPWNLNSGEEGMWDGDPNAKGCF